MLEPRKPRLNTATCDGFQMKTLGASSAIWRWMSRHSRAFSAEFEVEASVLTNPRRRALS